MRRTTGTVTGQPTMRIGDAERDACVDLLAEHHVRGRLSVDELDRRQRAALTATTEADLSSLLLDLPAEPTSGRAGLRTLAARAWDSRAVRAVVLAPAGLAAGGGLIAVSDTNQDVWKFLLGIGAAAAGFVANAAIERRRPGGEDPDHR
ncbi:DUF1707 domain-containing protein [Nocardioides sp. CFH 31398]|uniref:DUF1707 SHOCT-like domain-containing protein n=1 Tax=Nocardioides sp. CFH 31398 TaxID=2919579 RepID=UPI001F069F03|nr:DUF1707 domain-containing protein [Nocardioides sp. CFH 31398]MCH1866533.1 DUF1707 domain-containing protein [Nocardioides sp. CFH 31398]